jgi:N-acyl-phosphatidylethanolamine-hydrolysing phospholipase D
MGGRAAAVGVAVGAVLAGGFVAAPGADAVGSAALLGPAPRDGDGRFLNPVGPLAHVGVGVRFPFFLRRAYHSFAAREGRAAGVGNDGAFLRENARHSVPTVTWIGHATVLVQMDHVSLLSDPIWSERASPVGFVGPRRLLAPGVALEDLPPIDAVLVSHNHYDHLDLGSLAALARRDPRTRFLVPLGNAALLREAGVERVEELDWGESTDVRGVAVHCLPAQHWSQRGLTDKNRALWASWAAVGPGRRFYFAGDSGYFDGFAKIGAALGPFDLAAIPIAAYEPDAMMRQAHLDPEQAERAGRDVRARRVLGIHWGTFDLADEPQDEPPRRFLDAAAAAGAPESAWILPVGETREF